MYTQIIWDWNGTVLDDTELCRTTVNGLLTEHGHEPLSLEQYRAVFGFPIQDYYAKAGFDFEKEPYRELADTYMERYIPASRSCPLTPGATCALQYFKAKGIRQTVLSVSDTVTLKAQMENLGIAGFFDEIIGLDNIYAHGKGELAQAWRRKNPLPGKEILLIGDTLHDGEIARDMGCDCALVFAGHQSRERLLSAGYPVYDTLFSLLYDLTGRPEAALFDLDGTLAYTLPDVTACFNHVFVHYGYQQISEEEMRHYISKPMAEIFRLTLGEEFLKEKGAEAREIFLAYQKTHIVDHTVPYPAVPGMLSALREMGIPCGLQSNKTYTSAITIADTLFAGAFVHRGGLKPGAPAKPDPAMLWEAAEKMGISPEKVAYVGDSDLDVVSTHRAGMVPLTAAWGYVDREELLKAGAELLFDCPEQIISFFKGKNLQKK